MSSLAESTHRTVHSFVLRQGRITPAQIRAIDQHWSDYGLDYGTKHLALNQIFGRSAPKIMEIGSGMGDNAVKLARINPENDYIAVEVHKPGIGALLKQAASTNTKNIRVISEDVVTVLENQISNRCLEQVYIFFPDPWPKKRHNKRRLINARFISLLTSKMCKHGRLFVATDWQNLAKHILEVCDGSNHLVNLAGKGNYAPRPIWRPPTKFEQRGLGLNHKVWDFAYGVGFEN